MCGGPVEMLLTFHLRDIALCAFCVPVLHTHTTLRCSPFLGSIQGWLLVMARNNCNSTVVQIRPDDLLRLCLRYAGNRQTQVIYPINYVM